MKRPIFIGFLLGLALLFACTSPKVPEANRSVEGPSPELSAIDSLLWQRPDSALACLLPCFDTCRDEKFCVSTATEYNRHYANLLLAELLYKNYYPQTNRVELLQAMAYFDSLVVDGADTRGVSPQDRPRRDARRVSAQIIAFLDARAHYINGVGYYEQDSAVEACKEYMKVFEVMVDHFEKKELVGEKARFMALTYTRLSSLFSDMYLHEQAIYFSQLSLASNQELDVPNWHIARMLCEIGIQYNLLEQLDSADYYYKRAAIVLNDTNCLLYRDISTRRIVLSYSKKGIEENTLLKLHYLMSKSNGEIEYLLRCFTIGEIFYQEKQYDSALYYLNKVYNSTGRIALKKQAAEWLLDICKTQRKDDDVFEYADFLAPFATLEENQSEIKSQLTELYNSFQKKELERQHKEVLQKSRTRTIAVVGGLLIIILVIALLYHQNKKKLRSLESIEPDENEVLSKKWDQYAAFMEEHICQDILRSVNGENIKRSATPKDYPSLVLSDEQLQQLAFIVNRYFGPFEHQLEKHGIKASPIMVSLCHLYLLGIDEKQAAILLNRDYSSISRHGKKLKSAFETHENLTTFFRGIVLNR